MIKIFINEKYFLRIENNKIIYEESMKNINQNTINEIEIKKLIIEELIKLFRKKTRPKEYQTLINTINNSIIQKKKNIF